MAALAKHPDVVNYDLSSVKMLSCGAAPLSKDIARLAEKRVSVGREKIALRQGWGMTEYVASIFLIFRSRYITLNGLAADDCDEMKNDLLGYRVSSGRQRRNRLHRGIIPQL